MTAIESQKVQLGRRQFLQRAGVAIGVAGLWRSQQPVLAQAPASGFTLPPLPYAYDALEPHIDAQTMQIHHDKHHQAYITNLNTALQGHPDLQSKSLADLLKDIDALPEAIRMAVRNNGGGHYNHSLFWQVMGPGKGGEPSGTVAQAITSQFGSFATFKENFSKAAITRFGSGWAWLSASPEGKLAIESLPNQDTPVSAGAKPVLGLDVWEHAYYLKYKNVRPQYVAAWWNVVNWDNVEQRFQSATKS